MKALHLPLDHSMDKKEFSYLDCLSLVVSDGYIVEMKRYIVNTKTNIDIEGNI